MTTLQRLEASILAAGIPTNGVWGTTAADAGWHRAPTTTDAQKAQGDQIVAGFDWSAAAHAAWERTRARSDADGALATSPGPEMQFGRALLVEVALAFNGLIDVLASQATAVNRPALLALKRTKAQWVTAIRNRLAAGDGDPT